MQALADKKKITATFGLQQWLPKPAVHLTLSSHRRDVVVKSNQSVGRPYLVNVDVFRNVATQDRTKVLSYLKMRVSMSKCKQGDSDVAHLSR